MNFFAIVAGRVRDVRRIRVRQSVQDQLSREFLEQRERLVAEKERIPFEPSYDVGEDEVFIIQDFELPEYVVRAAHDTNQVEQLEIDDNTRVKSVFAVENAGETRVFFQKFYRSWLLRGGWTLLQEANTYTKLEEPGLRLDSSLTAAYEDKTSV